MAPDRPACAHLRLMRGGEVGYQPAEQGRFGVRAAAARAYAAEVALEIAPRLYEVTGGSAVNNSYGFDRTWRDVRTLVQHDPMVYAVRGVGDFFLNGALRENPVFVR